MEEVSGNAEQGGSKLLFESSTGGQLRVVTVFLTGDWVGAMADIVQDNEGPFLRIEGTSKRIDVPLFRGGDS